MKFFFTTLIITILFSGCATRNAFSKLDISKKQELSIENIRSGKMKSDTRIGGIFSSVYLNNIYPNEDKNTNNFYISIYIKDKNQNLTIKLNKELFTDMKELPHANKYSNLLPITSPWTKNYLVSFQNNENKELILKIDNGQFSSGELYYLKD